MSYRAAVLADSPVAYWRLGESPGATVAADEIDGNAGSYNGTPTLGVTGLLTDDANKAIQLPGDGSFIDSIDIPALDAPAAFTLECLIKLANGVGGKCFVSVTQLGATDRYLIFTDSGTDLFLQVHTADGAQNCGFAAGLLPGTVYHVVATYDAVSGAANLWLNGVNVKTVTITGGAPLTGSQVWLGKATFGYALNGVLDEAAIYTHVLADDRIAAHHEEAVSPSTDNNDALAQTAKFLDHHDPFVPGGAL